MAFSTVGQNLLLSRDNLVPRWYLTIAALMPDRTDGRISLWNGEGSTTAVLGGVSRNYVKCSDMTVGEIIYETGTVIRTLKITLPGAHPSVRTMIKDRIIRGRAAEVWLGLHDATSGALLDSDRLWKGFVNRAPHSRGAFGAGNNVGLELASQFRNLSRTFSGKKSDAFQRIRSDDRGRKYSSISEAVKVPWREGD